MSHGALMPVSKQKLHILPSSSWYLPSITDFSYSREVIAYGTFRSIVIVNILNLSDVKIIKTREKIEFIKFDPNQEILAAIGHDGKVKLWDPFSGPFPKFIGYAENLKNAICFDWLVQPLKKVLVIAYASNLIRIWDIKNNTENEVKCGMTKIEAISCHPRESNILAVGFQDNLVSIFDLDDCEVKKNLRGKNRPIHLAWSPFSDKLLQCCDNADISVWTIQNITGDITIDCATITSEAIKRNDIQAWVMAIWHPTKPDFILATNTHGQVGEFDVSSLFIPQMEVFSHEMGRKNKLFLNIVPCSSQKNMICTFSMDHVITVWNLETKKSVCDVPTVRNTIHCFEFQPLCTSGDDIFVAVATDDRIIIIFKINEVDSHTQLHCVYKNLPYEVFKVAWHPTKCIIAFCTGNLAKIGFIDFQVQDKNAVFLNEMPYYVYNICWGPCSKLSGSEAHLSKFFVYACLDGRISIIDIENENTKVNFSSLIEVELGIKDDRRYTDMAWNPDFTLFATGEKNGHIEVYDGLSFKSLFKIFGFFEMILHLRFSPTLSPSFQNWLAITIKPDTNIYIYDLNKASGNQKDTEASSAFLQILSGHTDCITNLVWNPHIDGQLATCSTDYTVRIWDIHFAHCIAKLSCFNTKMYWLSWSLLDPDIIYTGGEDCCLSKLKVSDHVNCTMDEVDMPVHITEQKIPIMNSENVESKDSENIESKDSENIESKDSENVMTKDSENVKTKDSENVKSKDQEVKFTELCGDDCLGTCAVAFEKEVLRSITENSIGVKEIFETINENRFASFLKTITDEESVTDKFLKLVENHAVDTTVDPCEESRIIQYIEEAWNERKLAASDVVIARFVSHDLWLETCMRYSLQLQESGLLIEAVMYLLISSKLHEAINMLKSKGFFGDAYILAKTRLPEDDPVITELLSLWSKKLFEDGCFVHSAYCSLFLRETVTAAETLCKECRKDCLEKASEILRNNGFLDEADKCFYWCLRNGLINQNWREIETLLSEYPNMQNLLWVMEVHQFFTEQVKELIKHKCGGITIEAEDETIQNSVMVWKRCLFNEKSFLSSLLDLLILKDIFNLDSENFVKEFNLLMSFVQNDEIEKSLAGTLYTVAMHICNFLFTLHTSGVHAAFDSLAHALQQCLIVDNLLHKLLLDVFCLLLLPFDIYGKDVDNPEAGQMKINSEDIIEKAYIHLINHIPEDSIFIKMSDVSVMLKTDFQTALEETSYLDSVKESSVISANHVIFRVFALNFSMLLEDVSN